MSYTVNQLSKLAGISVRTLHYYDQIGLLKPTYIAENGYRSYDEAELMRLQQILFFRELEFSLQDIKKLLSRPDYSVVAALQDQKTLMRLKRDRIDRLIKSINKTIATMNSNQKTNNEEMYNAFNDAEIKEYQDEVKQRWGNTEAYKQSMQRVGKMTKQEMEKLKADGKAFTQELANAMDKPVEHPDVQALIQKHYEGVQFFYECSIEMYRNLGNMYVDDPRFTAYYDAFQPGLAMFVRDAIRYYCDKQKN